MVESIANNGIPLGIFAFSVSMIILDLHLCLVFWVFATSLLCTMRELAGGRSVAVAVGISDRQQVTGER